MLIDFASETTFTFGLHTQFLGSGAIKKNIYLGLDNCFCFQFHLSILNYWFNFTYRLSLPDLINSQLRHLYSIESLEVDIFVFEQKHASLFRFIWQVNSRETSQTTSLK